MDTPTLPTVFEIVVPAGHYLLGDKEMLGATNDEVLKPVVGTSVLADVDDGGVLIVVFHYSPYHMHARTTPWGRFMTRYSMLFARLDDDEIEAARTIQSRNPVNGAGIVVVELTEPTIVRAETGAITIGDVRVDLAQPQKLWIMATSDFMGAADGSPVIVIEEGQQIELRDALGLGQSWMDQYRIEGFTPKLLRGAVDAGLTTDAAADWNTLLAMAGRKDVHLVAMSSEPFTPRKMSAAA